ncbi:MAG: DEAD/DEAH box helicase [Deltaproteobacteria bacterium]|nr:DEAD/DEAH box helicase [Deltaproteobacteria bacterium]MBW2583956.1 DEAD/DEAH box helicase [Deltaproteobacteria bacterium]
MAPFTITISHNLQLENVPSEIMEILTDRLEILNPKWIENERMKRWNRGTPKSLRFFDRVGSSGLWIPRGYMRQLVLLCRRHKIKYEIDDCRRSLPPKNFSFKGRLRPFQQKAVDEMLAKDFGTLSSATGSGKTIMALYMVARRRQPALIVVHTKDLASQWTERIETFLGIPAPKVGLIGSGKKELGDKITVALVQSLYKCVEEIADQIGFLVVDECHRCPSRIFTEAVTGFDARYMLGLSATPWRRDKLSKLIFWHLGDVHHEVDKAHLVETGDVLPAEVIVRETNFKPFYDPVNEYSKMLSELTADTDRNVLIASDVAQETLNCGGICLVLSDRKAHCENLQSLLKYRFKIDSELLTGDLNLSERQKVIERLNQNKVDVVIATGQLIGEGFDCKNLSTLFLATPISFSGRVLQYLGRVLRPAPGKKMARVFDYIDIHVETLTKAAQSRQRVYRQ